MTEKSLGTSDPITSLVLTRMLLGERCALIPIAKAQQGSASRFYIRARDTADMIFTETEDAQAMAQAWREGHE